VLTSTAIVMQFGVASVAAPVVPGRYLLNPLFGLLANAHAREVLTAAALLVALGAAYAIERGGLSMAMGAFVAGVMLSESSYRHQLEADVEPFRGVLLGLFFLAVGMSLELDAVAAHWRTILFYVVAYMIVKAAGIYAVARLFRAPRGEAVERAVMMAQGGEFAFVLYAAAMNAGIVNAWSWRWSVGSAQAVLCSAAAKRHPASATALMVSEALGTPIAFHDPAPGRLAGHGCRAP